MGELVSGRIERDGRAVLRPVGGCDALTLLAAASLRENLAGGDGTGLRAVAVPTRRLGWFDWPGSTPPTPPPPGRSRTRPTAGCPRRAGHPRRGGAADARRRRRRREPGPQRLTRAIRERSVPALWVKARLGRGVQPGHRLHHPAGHLLRRKAGLLEHLGPLAVGQERGGTPNCSTGTVTPAAPSAPATNEPTPPTRTPSSTTATSRCRAASPAGRRPPG